MFLLTRIDVNNKYEASETELYYIVMMHVELNN